jgi:phosphoribosylglycinamide formyltransferase 1
MTAMRIGVMTSGRGNALRMVLRACAAEPGIGSVVAVAANLDCPALAVAAAEGITTTGRFEPEAYASRAERDAAIAAFFLDAGVDFIFTPGYTDMLTACLLQPFPDRVMSVYPSLLPAFAEDEEAIGPALDLGVKYIGVTFHFRAPNSGAGGGIITQEPIAVDVDDTIDTVTPKIAEVEERLLPQILLAFAEDRVRVEGRKVRILSPVPA